MIMMTSMSFNRAPNMFGDNLNVITSSEEIERMEDEVVHNRYMDIFRHSHIQTDYDKLPLIGKPESSAVWG